MILVVHISKGSQELHVFPDLNQCQFLTRVPGLPIQASETFTLDDLITSLTKMKEEHGKLTKESETIQANFPVATQTRSQ